MCEYMNTLGIIKSNLSNLSELMRENKGEGNRGMNIFRENRKSFRPSHWQCDEKNCDGHSLNRNSIDRSSKESL